MRQAPSWIVASLACVSLSTTVSGEEPTAAKIIERAIAAERWIHDVDSIQFRIESEWKHSEREIAIRRVRAERERAGVGGPVPDDLPHLQPRSTTTIDVAFDTWRYRKVIGAPHFELRIWDGEAAYLASGPSRDSIQSVGLADEPTAFGWTLLTDLSWPRTDDYRFWFSRPGRPTGRQFDPQRFTLIGREAYRGTECHVLETNAGFHRWYVGVEDGLIRGMQVRVINQGANILPLIRPIAEARGVRIRDIREWSTFVSELEEEERRAVNDAYFAALLPETRLLAEHFVGEYEEVAPGWRFPLLQGYTLYTEAPDGEVFQASTRMMRIVDLRINEPLDDALFSFDVPEGVEVTDHRFDVPIFYQAEADMTAEQLQVLLVEARRDHAEMEAQVAFQAELVDQAALPFPEGATWINGETATWEDLRGKVVVLAFFANWCGPCRGMYPDLIELYEQRDRLGIAVIGVHTPSTTETVERYCEQMGIAFPVMIDVLQGDRPAYWSACRVAGIPHVMVVRPDGTIAGSGWFRQMISLARTMRPASQ